MNLSAYSFVHSPMYRHEELVDDLAHMQKGGRVFPLSVLLQVTAFQKVVGYGMYIWGSAVTAIYTLAFADGVNAVLLGGLGAIAVSALFALRRLVLLMIQIGEAAAEKKLREIAATRTTLTEEEVHRIIVEEKMILDDGYDK